MAFWGCTRSELKHTRDCNEVLKTGKHRRAEPFLAFSWEIFQSHNIILIQNWWRTNAPREKGNKMCLKAKWSKVDDCSFFYKILLLLKRCILHLKYCVRLFHSWTIKTTPERNRSEGLHFFFSTKATLIGYTTHPGGSFYVTAGKRRAGIKSVEAEKELPFCS